MYSTSAFDALPRGIDLGKLTIIGTPTDASYSTNF